MLKKDFNRVIKSMKNILQRFKVEDYPLYRIFEYIDKNGGFIGIARKGFAYKAPDGSIYFSIDKFIDYGKLSHGQTGIKSWCQSGDDMKKKTVDFALWKLGMKKRRDILGTPLGKGRPGWHIECSAMSGDA